MPYERAAIVIPFALVASCVVALLLAVPPSAVAARQALSMPPEATLDHVFTRMYNVDFTGAHALLDQRVRTNPSEPLTYSVRAVAYTFAELQRLHILETEFFLDDSRVTSEKPLQPDPDVRARVMAAVDEAKRRAEARLQTSPDDRDALFALCMAAGVTADYTALVERKQLRGLLMERDVQTYANRLIDLHPPVYDAYHVLGVLEYVNSRVPFYVKWFVRFKQIEGSEQKAIQYLKIVVDHGRYYGPFAKVLLAVLHLRAKRPAEARALLADLARQFPENPLFPKELARIDQMAPTLRAAP